MNLHLTSHQPLTSHWAKGSAAWSHKPVVDLKSKQELLSDSSQWYRLIDAKTMNGGVLCETNAQLPSAPVLKQELITEHYAITAKRPAAKEKEKEKCVHH